MPSLTGPEFSLFHFPALPCRATDCSVPTGLAQPRLDIVPFYRRLIAIRTACRRRAPGGRDEARICIAGLIARAAFMPSLTGPEFSLFHFPALPCRATDCSVPTGLAQPRLDIVPFYRRLIAIRTACRRQAPGGKDELTTHSRYTETVRVVISSVPSTLPFNSKPRPSSKTKAQAQCPFGNGRGMPGFQSGMAYPSRFGIFTCGSVVWARTSSS